MFTFYVVIASLFILGGVIQHFIVSKRPQYQGFTIQVIIALLWPLFSVPALVATCLAVIAYFVLACHVLYHKRFRR